MTPSKRFREVIHVLRKKRARQVCIEAGHIYVNEEPGESHVSSLKAGGELSRELQVAQISHRRCLFVDDFNPDTNILDLDNYLSLATESGFKPDKVFMESSLQEEAWGLLRELDGQENVRYKGSERYTKKHNVRLINSQSRPTCCLLDAAFYKRRLECFDYAITVLPGDSCHGYKNQQKGVRQILRLLGNRKLPIIVVYYYENGEFTFSIQ